MKVLIIGSGPILIGQAAEFDYAGTQACRSLREEGITTVLVNSNPATIMTDPGVADVTYLEPLTVEVLERIIARERPDGLLATLGGQTGLNLAVALSDAGVLERYNVRLLGTPLKAIKQAEDREAFKQLLIEIGEPVPESVTAMSVDDALGFADRVGYPLVVRPAYTLGGTGGGFADDREELVLRTAAGISASPIGQVLIERSLLGWKELEYEVMRDASDTCITICNMENIDPMGVHTGDSIVVAPSQTLTDKEYQMLRSSALKIIRALGIEGGCNVQFALHPDRSPSADPEAKIPYYVIEVNPRVSRSSALASKATGYPIARVASKIAIGKRLSEIPNAVTKKTTAAFEPALDYVVVKIPRWPFDKFPTADRSLGTQMKATGEVMAIDRSFEAALHKAIRSLEIKGRDALWEAAEWAAVRDPAEFIAKFLSGATTDQRMWALLAALRRGATVDAVHEATSVDRWFLRKLEGMVRFADTELRGKTPTPGLMRRAKRLGFPDAAIGTLTGMPEEEVRRLRTQWGIVPVYKMVDTCAAEFDAVTPYFYSTYEEENEAEPLAGPKAVILGAGPIRIGQGIEFDCCCVQSAMALEARGVAAIMVNSNPETVSTDFDASARLYFEPLDAESVSAILANEGTDDGDPIRVLAQFGGQTALNLADKIASLGGIVAGTSPDAIGLAEDRRRFNDFATERGIPQPPGGTAETLEEALAVAEEVGYPVLVRPSFVLGGRGMEIVHSSDQLAGFFAYALEAGTGRVLVDKYLRGREVEVDAVSDGRDTLVAGIMEHIERAGVHSGDSYAVYPAQNLLPAERDEMVALTRSIAAALPVKGLLNIQFILDEQGKVWVLEVNPRASRTVPFLSKVTGVPLTALAVAISLGSTLAAEGYARADGIWPSGDLVAVKAPVFSMAKLLNVDSHLGPEMKSTGEVMGVDRTFAPALWKSLIAAGLAPAPRGTVVITVADVDKEEAVPIIEGFHWLGYDIVATPGTAALIRRLGIDVTEVTKIGQGSAEITAVIRSGSCAAVVNTPTGGASADRDGFLIRRAAVEARVPCLTSLDTALAVVTALRASGSSYDVAPLADYRGVVAKSVILETAGVLATRTVGDLGVVLSLRSPGIAAQARAGQFVHVRPGERFDPLLRRPYSFGRIDREAGEIDIILKPIGEGGEWIGSRRPGDSLDVLGPLGSAFVVGRATSNLLLVAGGTGIAPMRVIAEQEAPRRNVTLLMGGRSIQHLWPASQLPATVEYVTTTEDGSFGVKGRVTEALPRLLEWADQLLACGPWPMLAALGRLRDEAARASSVYPGRAVLLDAQIAVEQHMGCAMGVCRACVIVTASGNARVCREGPVFDLGEVSFAGGDPAVIGAAS